MYNFPKTDEELFDELEKKIDKCNLKTSYPDLEQLLNAVSGLDMEDIDKEDRDRVEARLLKLLELKRDKRKFFIVASIAFISVLLNLLQFFSKTKNKNDSK